MTKKSKLHFRKEYKMNLKNIQNLIVEIDKYLIQKPHPKPLKCIDCLKNIVDLNLEIKSQLRNYFQKNITPKFDKIKILINSACKCSINYKKIMEQK